MSGTPFHVVVPARYGSTRLPGKPLQNIAGKLLVERVYNVASKSGAASVVVATDDDRVRVACEGLGIPVCMTSPDHQSGTDRCAEVATTKGWPDDAVVVNVQGDEPLLPPDYIAQAANALGDADMATLAAPIKSDADLTDPNRVKVVCSASGRALYFSRAPIPWHRDHEAQVPAPTGPLHHVGLYAYRVATLTSLTALPVCDLERTEALEQLRALYHGLSIQVAVVAQAPAAGVDTPEDLARVEAVLSKAGAA